MKIMYFASGYWEDTKGGSQEYVHEIVKRARKKYDVIEVYQTNARIKNAYTIKEMDISTPGVSSEITSAILMPLNVYVASRGLSSLIASTEPDILHVQMFSPYIPKDTPLKRIVTLHDVRSYFYRKSSPLSHFYFATAPYHARKISKTCREFDVFICASETTKRDAIRCMPFLKDKEIYAVYNGVDSQRFSPHQGTSNLKDSLLENYDIDVDREFIILVPGRIDFVKGQDLAIKAFNKLPKYIKTKAHLLIVGYITDRKYFLSLKTSKSNITFITNVKDIAQYYAIADIVVVPTRYYEGFCLVTVEALSSGKPVIVTDQPVTREVCGELAVYIPPLKYDGIYHLHPNDIASKIVYLYENEDLRNKIGSKGRAMVKQRFSWDKTFKKTQRIYEALTS